MSIINDALKKLQNNPSSQTPEEKKLSTQASTPMDEPQWTSAQKAGFQPAPPSAGETTVTSAMKPKKSSKVPTENKGSESSIVYILGVLCLMIGLFAPIVNKQSVMSMLMQSLPKPSHSARIAPARAVAVTPAKTQPAPAAVVREEKPAPAASIQSFFNNLAAAPTPAAATPSAASSDTAITITGIMTQGSKSVALINGQVYEEGDTVNGVKIIKITSNAVVVAKNGVERTIRVTSGR